MAGAEFGAAASQCHVPGYVGLVPTVGALSNVGSETLPLTFTLPGSHFLAVISTHFQMRGTLETEKCRKEAMLVRK